jgi:hypothetical protein
MRVSRFLRIPHHAHPASRRRERGQTMIFVVLALGIFMIGFMGFAADLTNMWFRKQAAQSAADSACVGTAMDMLLASNVPSATPTGYTIGTDFDCTSGSVATPCYYANLNGYNGAGLTANTESNKVSVSFYATILDLGAVDSKYGVAKPYTKVEITQRVKTFFMPLITGSRTTDLKAAAVCGLVPTATPIPLVILHPTSDNSLSTGGNSGITIIGGPRRTISVDSSGTSAVSSGLTADLSQAGPTNTGGDFGVYGGVSTKPAGVNLGTTGNYIYPASPQGDPYKSLSTPSVPGSAGTATPQPFGYHGCPDPSGCVEFTGGNYTSCSTSNNLAPGGNGCLILPYGGSSARFSSYGNWSQNTAYAAGARVEPAGARNPGNYIFEAQNAGTSQSGAGPNPWNQTVGGTQTDNTITWKNIGVVTNSPNTAIFAPGLYYVGTGGLDLGSNSTVRMSTATGDGSGGATFYFSTTATLNVSSNSGSSIACTSASSGSGTPNNCIVSYKVDGTTNLTVPSRAMQCPGGTAVPASVPNTVDGNILMGPCSGTYGDPGGQYRGIIFFQRRNVAASPRWGGGGSFISAGLMYFHQCHASSSTDTSGLNCDAPASGGYGTTLTMRGNSGSASYAIGNIVVDKLATTGTAGINMLLNPSSSFSLLKAQLLR